MKRLNVEVPTRKYLEFKRLLKARGQTVTAWVIHAIDFEFQRKPSGISQELDERQRKWPHRTKP